MHNLGGEKGAEFTGEVSAARRHPAEAGAFALPEALQDGDQQSGLAAEIPANQLFVDLGTGGNLSRRGSVVPALGKHLDAGSEQRLLGGELVALAPLERAGTSPFR